MAKNDLSGWNLFLTSLGTYALIKICLDLAMTITGNVPKSQCQIELERCTNYINNQNNVQIK
jgi:hypothetical protein